MMRGMAGAICAAFLLILGGASAGPAYRSVNLDVTKQDAVWSNSVTRGEAFTFRVYLYNRGATYTNNDLTGYIFIASNRTATAGQMWTSSAKGTGYVDFSVTAAKSMGLSSNDTFPTGYCASVVLTNATTILRWAKGVAVHETDGAVSGVAAAAMTGVVNWDTLTSIGALPWTNVAATVTNIGVAGGLLTGGASVGLTTAAVQTAAAPLVNAATGSIAAVTLTGIIPLDRLSGITSNQIDATTDAAYRSGGIDGATATQIVHDVTDAGFLATSQAVVAATQTIAGASVSGAVEKANYIGTGLGDSLTAFRYYDEEGTAVYRMSSFGTYGVDARTNEWKFYPTSGEYLYMGGNVGLSYYFGRTGVYAWTLGIGDFGTGLYQYAFGNDGNVVTNGAAVTNLNLAGVNTNNASQIDSGTLDDARIASTIARDIEVDAATNGINAAFLAAKGGVTNGATVTNSLQLGGIAAESYNTNNAASLSSGLLPMGRLTTTGTNIANGVMVTDGAGNRSYTNSLVITNLQVSGVITQTLAGGTNYFAGRVLVGSASPPADSAIAAESLGRALNLRTASPNGQFFYCYNSNNYILVRMTDANGAGAFVMRNQTTDTIGFGANGYSYVATPYGLAIGTNLTQGGYQLDVNGSALVRTNLTVSGAVTSSVMGCTAFNLAGTNAVRAAQNGASMPAGGLVVTGGVLSAGNAIYYSEGAVSGTVTGYVAAASSGPSASYPQSIQFSFDGGGGIIETGKQTAVWRPYAYSIRYGSILTCTTNVGIKFDLQTNGVSLLGSATLGLWDTATNETATTTNTWTYTVIASNTWLRCNVLANTNATQACLALGVMPQ